MNIFKEMGLSVYSFKSYKEFLNNRKSKVFLFGVVVMLIYFFISVIVPFIRINGSGLASAIREGVPEFELEDGVLWVDETVQIDDGINCIWIDTNPDEVFYDAVEMEQYYSGYTSVILMDSEKIILKNNGAMQQYRFAELGIDFSRDDLIALVPSMYFTIAVVLIISYIVMTALFFFGVLFVALIGMIVASCLKYQLTFGQLYLLGIYSRVLPLLIKVCVSFLPFSIPYFWVINFGISVVILGVVIRNMRDDLLKQQMNQGNQGNQYSFDDRTWM